jgi:uncharacterized protein (TIGR00375 family)
MRIIADFHIHSKYSRATSRDLNIENLVIGAKRKGINLLGTGDFTHPAWFSEIVSNLEEDGSGFLIPKSGDNNVKFVLSSEISSIYKKGEKVRKIHNIVLTPSLKEVRDINLALAKIGNLHSDGRPILGLDAERLVEIVLGISPNSIIIPAHIWTPWFSLFGSNSGFDTLQECYGKYTRYIYAYETGLSSDPEMNWRIKQLDGLSMLSNSDAHSAKNLMREANVFEWENSQYNFENLLNTLKNKDTKKLKYTLEFFPEEGKYHYDGHRLCNLSLKPTQSKKYNNICPVCGKLLVIGVLNRVEELADRPEGFIPENSIPFKSLIPLNEIIAESIGSPVTSKKVIEYYNNLIKNLGNEFKILLESTEREIKEKSSLEIASGVVKMREGKIYIEPGYDGVYGKIQILSDKKYLNNKNNVIKQKTLF